MVLFVYYGFVVVEEEEISCFGFESEKDEFFVLVYLMYWFSLCIMNVFYWSYFFVLFFNNNIPCVGILSQMD